MTSIVEKVESMEREETSESRSSTESAEEPKVVFMSQKKARKARNELFEEDGVMKIYHKYYSQVNVADIPTRSDGQCVDVENEELVLPRIPETVVFNEEDVRRMARVTNRPLETVLIVWTLNDYDFKQTIEMLRTFVMPDLVPEKVRNFLKTHITEAREGYTNTTKKTGCSEFHFAKLMSKTVTSQMLVQTYYDEKKKGCDDESDVSMSEGENGGTDDEGDEDFKKKLADNKISFVEKPAPAKRGRKRGATKAPAPKKPKANDRASSSSPTEESSPPSEPAPKRAPRTRSTSKAGKN